MPSSDGVSPHASTCRVILLQDGRWLIATNPVIVSTLEEAAGIAATVHADPADRDFFLIGTLVSDAAA